MHYVPAADCFNGTFNPYFNNTHLSCGHKKLVGVLGSIPETIHADFFGYISISYEYSAGQSKPLRMVKIDDGIAYDVISDQVNFADFENLCATELSTAVFKCKSPNSLQTGQKRRLRRWKIDQWDAD